MLQHIPTGQIMKIFFQNLQNPEEHDQIFTSVKVLNNRGYEGRPEPLKSAKRLAYVVAYALWSCFSLHFFP